MNELSRIESALSLRLPPCMGGFCAHRDNCERYHDGRGVPPAERLCLRAWAKRLQERHQGGERLTRAQVSAYRDALHLYGVMHEGAAL